MNKSSERWLYSIGGVIAVFVGIVIVNYILGAAPARIDLTEGKLYTLSDGTRKVLGKLEAPVKIRFYFNQGDANVPVGIRVFAGRVEDLQRCARPNSKLVIVSSTPADSDGYSASRRRRAGLRATSSTSASR
jgi:ABC-type uncharacterized transport system involved in gliding motility auxiliary subunit